MRRSVLLFSPFALLAACAQEPPQVPLAPPPPVMVSDECDAQAAQFALGQAYTQPLGEEMRMRSRAERVRALRPGEMVTMEFNARRLTIDLDAEGRIVRARCG